MARLSAALALVLAAGAYAQCGDPQTMTTDDKQPNDFLGGAISMSSTASGVSLLAGVGADNFTFLGNAGSVYQFTRVGGLWGQTGNFFANDAQPSDYFGTAVGYDDPHAVIGAVGVGDTGAAYFFTRFGSSWQQVDKVIPADAASGDDLGRSVAIDGNLAVVGAPLHDINVGGSIDANAGAAYVYARNGSGDWAHIFKMYGFAAERNPNDFLGQAVAVSGQRIMAGVPGADSFNIPNSGQAKVIRYDPGALLMVLDGSFWAPDRGDGDRFGDAVDVSGPYAVVGAPRHDSNNKLDNGAAYCWRHDGTQWVYDGKLTPSDPTDVAYFGSGVSLWFELFGPTRVVVAASGANKAYVFRRVGPGEWVQDARYLDPDGPDDFGTAIDVYGEHVVVGDWGDDPAGVTNAGALYAFRTPLSGSDSCDGAWPVAAGVTYGGCTEIVTLDGLSGCLSGFQTSPDVWYKYTATCTGRIGMNTFNSGFDTVLSVHTGCPGGASNMVACNDDWSIFSTASSVYFQTVAGQTYLIRVSGKNGARGEYVLNVADCDECYADCNADGQLTVADFGCFQTKFVAQNAYADCNADGNLTVADFGCFQTKFVAGCP